LPRFDGFDGGLTEANATNPTAIILNLYDGSRAALKANEAELRRRRAAWD
jgi:hypothetical protein